MRICSDLNDLLQTPQAATKFFTGSNVDWSPINKQLWMKNNDDIQKYKITQ